MIYTNLRLTVAGVLYNVTVADRPTTPTAYAPATVTWSQQNGLDQPDAATLTVDVSLPAGTPWPAQGDVVSLLADAFPYSDLQVFAGVVDIMRRTRRTLYQPDGTTFDADVITLTCVDWRAIAARRVIGDQPWPLESASDRLARIMALAPDLTWDPFYFSNLAGLQVAPRDVDSVSVLQLMADTVSGADYIVSSTAAGLGVKRRHAEGPFVLKVPADGSGPRIEDDSTTVRIPAGLVADAPRVLDRDGLVNRASLSYPVAPDADANTWPDTTATFTDPASIATHGTASYSTRCDAIAPTRRRDAVRWATAAGAPRWRLDGPLTIRLGGTVSYGSPWLQFAVVAIAEVVYREGWPLVITDAPETDLAEHRIIGTTLTLGSDDVESVTITTEPWQLASNGGAGFHTFRGVPCNLMGAITAADCVLFSDAELVEA